MRPFNYVQINQAGNCNVLKVIAIFAAILSLVGCFSTQQAQMLTNNQIDSNAAKGISPGTTKENLLLPQNHKRLEEMVGTWRVQQTIRATAQTEPTVYKDLTARRTWLEDGILQEVMEGTLNGKQFARMALLRYNDIAQKYEMASTDTPIPEVFSQQNNSNDGSKALTFEQTFNLEKRGNKLSGQTIKLRQVLWLDEERNVLQQYLTLPTGEEFLAIEYVYTRHS